MVWRRHGDVLAPKGVAILNSWFIRLLLEEHARFRSRKGAGQWKWNSTIKRTVEGIVPSRLNKLCWYDMVHTVYAPMNWGKEHWVALVIDLKLGKIEVLDSFHQAYSDDEMDKIMQPVDEILSMVVNDLVDRGSPPILVPVEFTHSRAAHVPQNRRTGDCGPLTVKFIELHAQDVVFSDITDDMVDNMRARYAIELYEEFIQPII